MDRFRAVQLAVAVWLASGVVACSLPDAPAPGHPPSVIEPAGLSRLPRETLTLPNSPTSVKFAVIGDSGRGTRPQLEVAAQMERYHATVAFPFVLMLGDNLYEGAASPDDYRLKFEEPYKALLGAGVKFYAALGNHDDPREVDYQHFNMRGRRYYRFAPPGNFAARLTTQVEFFALDSTYLDRAQLSWLEEALANSTADWKICFLHHPIYTSGRYRAAAFVNRATLESMFVRHHVNVVFSGHEHLYQRSTLQRGVQYFISGAAGSLRPGDGTPARYIARTYANDYSFMLVEIEGDALHFQSISREGVTVDAGRLTRGAHPPALPAIKAADTAALR